MLKDMNHGDANAFNLELNSCLTCPAGAFGS